MDAPSIWIPVILSALGIVGTLLGSWVTYHHLLRVERARWAREDLIRYNLERLQAYTEFLTSGAVALTEAISVQAATPEQLAVLQTARADAHRTSVIELQRAYFQIRILATPPVRSVAESLFLLLQEPASDDRDKRIAPVRDAFIEAAQRELDVPLDLLPGARKL